MWCIQSYTLSPYQVKEVDIQIYLILQYMDSNKKFIYTHHNNNNLHYGVKVEILHWNIHIGDINLPQHCNSTPTCQMGYQSVMYILEIQTPKGAQLIIIHQFDVQTLELHEGHYLDRGILYVASKIKESVMQEKWTLTFENFLSLTQFGTHILNLFWKQW